MSDTPALGRRYRVATAYAVWLVGVFAYFVPAATWSPVSRFDTARAVVELRTLSIDAYADNTGDRSRAHGRWYSDKAPVPGLLAAIPYAGYRVYDAIRGGTPKFTAIGTEDFPARRVYVNNSFQRGLYVCSVATAAVSGALVGVFLFWMLRRRVAPRVALLAATVTVLGTPLFPYATSLYGHILAAAFLLGAVAAVDGGPGAPLNLTPRRTRIAGACLALAPGCEYIVAAPSAIIGAWILWRAVSERPRVVRDLALGALGPIAVVCAYHWICFGAPWRTPYSFIQREEFAAGHRLGLFGIQLPRWEGIWGLTVGTRRGLFYVAPVAIVGVLGALVLSVRRRDGTTRVLLLAAVALLCLNAGYYMWWGGAATGPRHLVPVLAVLGFGIAWAFSQKGWAIAAGVLALVSFSNMLVVTAVGLEAPEEGDVLFGYAYRMLAQGRIAHMSAASNLGIELGLAPAASLGPVLAWVVLGFRYVWRRLEEELHPRELVPVRA